METEADRQRSEQIRRRLLQDTLRQEFEAKLEKRIDRYLELNHQKIIPCHYFASASSECINLYRDGYYFSAVMVSHTINEGILKLIVERNDIAREEGKRGDQLIEDLKVRGIVSKECADASMRIWRSFRDDIHHMNPPVAAINFPDMAKSNLKDLMSIEEEVFSCDIRNGRFAPKQPLYWDIQEDGTAPGFLRCD